MRDRIRQSFIQWIREFNEFRYDENPECLGPKGWSNPWPENLDFSRGYYVERKGWMFPHESPEFAIDFKPENYKETHFDGLKAFKSFEEIAHEELRKQILEDGKALETWFWNNPPHYILMKRRMQGMDKPYTEFY